MVAIGIDIGTTTICAVAVNIRTGYVEKTLSADNRFLPAQDSGQKMQDTENIWRIVSELYGKLEKEFQRIACIGVTGQMHGIIYIDEEGGAVSPLYTWQNQLAKEIKREKKTYLQAMEDLSGYKIPVGYGASTYFYHVSRDMVPETAVGFCCITDYVIMKLTGRKQPLCHSSNASGIGFFDLEKRCFDLAAIERAGLKVSFFPQVVSECTLVGTTRKGVPVCIGIGDNQASFAGAVSEVEDSIFVNVGTGSQISIATRQMKARDNLLEIRPFINDTNLYVGSALCGGKAFAMLERFYQEVLQMAGISSKNALYDVMLRNNRTRVKRTEPVRVATRFSGTRMNPEERGEIYNISEDNFTPWSLTEGVLQGIADELYLMYKQMQDRNRHTCLIGAGNGIRKNPVLQKLMSQTFDIPLRIPLYKEEAAYGAALFSMVGADVYKTLSEAQKIIKYI